MKEAQIRKLHFITATFPPSVCGVGDHTANLAAELAKTLEVKVLTSTENASGPESVKVEKAFNLERPQNISRIVDSIASDVPDWIILQYNPFGFLAPYAFNPYLAITMSRIKHRYPLIKIGVVVHESFIPVYNWRSFLLSKWLKTQLWMLGRVADVIFTTTQPWALKLKTWFHGKVIQHLPVGSNIPCVPTKRDEIRANLGISNGTIVLGLFGRIRKGHGGRGQKSHDIDYIMNAVKRCLKAKVNVLVLYVGFEPSEARKFLSDLPLMADGPLTPAETSRRFAAMDIYMLPIDEGVSTRRTSLMTALQHGVSTVTTAGPATDQILLQQRDKAFALTDSGRAEDFANNLVDLVNNPRRREELSNGARNLFSQEFSWPRIGSVLLDTIGTLPSRS